MKKFCALLILVSGISVNSYALVNVGLRGGYTYESLKTTEVHMTMKTAGTTVMDTTFIPTDEDAETKHPTGFGGELFCEITPPVIPLGVELGIGFYTGSFTETDEDTAFPSTVTSTINSIKISALGKYYIKGIPTISPWVSVGPFLGLNTYKMKMEIEMGTTTVSAEYDGSMVPNFGVLGGIGVNIGIIPNLSFNVGALFDYFIVSKGKMTMEEATTEMTIEPKNSQWNLNILVGISYDIL